MNILLIQDIDDSFCFQIDGPRAFAGWLNDEAVACADFWFSHASFLKIFEMHEAIYAVVGVKEGKASIWIDGFDGSETTIHSWAP
jgi:hypothetical protein